MQAFNNDICPRCERLLGLKSNSSRSDLRVCECGAHVCECRYLLPVDPSDDDHIHAVRDWRCSGSAKECEKCWELELARIEHYEELWYKEQEENFDAYLAESGIPYYH